MSKPIDMITLSDNPEMGFKVVQCVQRNGENEFYSFAIYGTRSTLKRGYGVQYLVGKDVVPQKYCGPLSVFPMNQCGWSSANLMLLAQHIHHSSIQYEIHYCKYEQSNEQNLFFGGLYKGNEWIRTCDPRCLPTSTDFASVVRLGPEATEEQWEDNRVEMVCSDF